MAIKKFFQGTAIFTYVGLAITGFVFFWVLVFIIIFKLAFKWL